MSSAPSHHTEARRVRWLPVALLSATMVVGLVAASRWNAAAGQVQLSIDMDVSAGTRAHLYVNDETQPPLRVALEPGRRRVYTFTGTYTHVSRLRLDPTDARDAAIVICGFSLTDDDGPVVQVGPVSPDAWGGVDVTAGDAPAGCHGYRATSANPILYRDVDIPVADGPLDHVGAWLAPWRTAQQAWPPLLLATAAVLLLGVGRARWPSALAAVLALVCVLLLVPVVTTMDTRLDPPTLAVSLASYAGRSAPANRAAMQVALVCSVMAGLALGWAARGRGPAAGDTETRPWSQARSPLPRGAFAVVAAATLLALVPDYPAHLAAATTGVCGPHWDMDNVVLWQSLSHRGMHALREFWFPYGGTYLFDRPAPWGGLAQWLYQGSMYVGLLVAMTMAAGGRLAVGTALLLLIGLGELLGVFQQTSRYLLSVGIVLAHAGIRADAGLRQAARLSLWLLCGLGIFVYPEQLVYAAPACLAHVLLDVARGSVTARWSRVRRLLDDFGVPALTLIFALAVWWGTGQLAGTIAFYRSLPAHAVYGAIPTDVAASLRQPLLAPFVVVVLPFIFVGVGICERWLARTDAQRLAADVLVGTGLVGWMMLQKHIVRPWGEFQYLGNLVVGLVIAAVVGGTARRGSAVAALGLLMGLAMTPLLEPGVAGRVAARVAHVPALVAADARLLARGEEAFAEARRERFAPARFANHSDEQRAAEALRAAANGAPFTAFVLGDAPIIYALLGQDPPWITNEYNASPLDEQQRVVAWIDERRPDLVALNTGGLISDSVPSAVRVPLIYGTVVRDYVPFGAVGRFELLRRRRADEALALRFWRAQLGSMVELGFLPAASRAGRWPACTAAPCARYLRLTTPADWNGGRVAFTLNAAGQEFGVALHTTPGARTYHVRLDRLWFWQALAATTPAMPIGWSGLPHAVSAEVFDAVDGGVY